MSHPIFPTTKKAAEKNGTTYSSSENRNAQFPTRLRTLREEKGVSQAVLAQKLGISKSTLGLWETGDTLPDAKSLYDLADYFGVSTDYLLCRTETASMNLDVRYICDYIGISEEAIVSLHERKDTPIQNHVFSYLIEDGRVLGKIIDYYLSFAADNINKSPFCFLPLDVPPADYRIRLAEILDTLPRDRDAFFEKCDSEYRQSATYDYLKKYLSLHDCLRILTGHAVKAAYIGINRYAKRTVNRVYSTNLDILSVGDRELVESHIDQLPMQQAAVKDCLTAIGIDVDALGLSNRIIWEED